MAIANGEAPLKADAAARARDEARAAEAEKVSAVEASREAARMMSPVSIFISRKTQRLYVRQSFQPVLESPITIHDADHPIGTHIYTVLDYANGGADLRWSAVSMDSRQLGPSGKSRRGDVTLPSRVAGCSPCQGGARPYRIPRTSSTASQKSSRLDLR